MLYKCLCRGLVQSVERAGCVGLWNYSDFGLFSSIAELVSWLCNCCITTKGHLLNLSTLCPLLSVQHFPYLIYKPFWCIYLFSNCSLKIHVVIFIHCWFKYGLERCTELADSLPKKLTELSSLSSPLFHISQISWESPTTLKLTPISMVTEADMERSRQPLPRASRLQRHKLCIITAAGAAAAWDSMRLWLLG